MTPAAGRTAMLLAIAVLAGCAQAPPEGGSSRDTTSAEQHESGPPERHAGTWPESGAIDFREDRALDLTGDGRNETVIAAAHGPSWDSLDVSITIEAADGDTLWHEAWPSLLYFKYEPIEEKADSTVARIVRDHVEQLLARERFTMEGGLPPMLRQAGDPDAIMRDALHYHLAELDWRRQAGLTPAQPTPPDAHSSITVESVPTSRVDAVLEDVRGAPSFMYYAGGEATYVIAWSRTENAFVRIHSCC